MNKPPMYNRSSKILDQDGNLIIDKVTINKNLNVFLVKDVEEKKIMFNKNNIIISM